MLRLSLPIIPMIPAWDPGWFWSSLGLLYEPLESVTLRDLSWKMFFLMVITSAAAVSEWHVLEARPELFQLLLLIYLYRLIQPSCPRFFLNIMFYVYYSFGGFLSRCFWSVFCLMMLCCVLSGLLNFKWIVPRVLGGIIFFLSVMLIVDLIIVFHLSPSFGGLETPSIRHMGNWVWLF